jgi:hypothetical protein
MATFILLADYTDQGIRTVKDSPKRLDSTREMASRLDVRIKEFYLCMGGSTGINLAGAIRLARQLGRGKTIVTILADYGQRYQSKLFNPEFLKGRHLPVPGWME